MWELELGFWGFDNGDGMTRRGQILFFAPAFLLFFVFVLLPSTQTLLDSFYSHDATQRHFVGTLYYRYVLLGCGRVVHGHFSRRPGEHSRRRPRSGPARWRERLANLLAHQTPVAQRSGLCAAPELFHWRGQGG